MKKEGCWEGTKARKGSPDKKQGSGKEYGTAEGPNGTEMKKATVTERAEHKRPNRVTSR